MIKKVFLIIGIIGLLFLVFKRLKRIDLNPNYEVGQAIDSLNHVLVYYNGGVDNVIDRNTKDGYNLGLEYQCVEFVKRYYYEQYGHRMPDSYGHAKSFFDEGVKDGNKNKTRNLFQFTNPSNSPPEVGDLVVMRGSIMNRYGHVAIISKVSKYSLEIIQQNPGPFSSSREIFSLGITAAGNWKIENSRILGWLRK